MEVSRKIWKSDKILRKVNKNSIEIPQNSIWNFRKKYGRLKKIPQNFAETAAGIFDKNTEG